MTTGEKPAEQPDSAVSSDRWTRSDQERSTTLEEYETIFDTVEDAVLLLDVDRTADDRTYRYRRVNPAYETITGLTDTEIRGRTPAEIFSTETAAAVTERYDACVEQAATIDDETTLSLPAGERTLETKLTPTVENGTVEQLVGIVRDVTAQTRTERELTRSRDLLEKAEQLAAVGGWELDLRSNDLRWTDGTREIFEVDAGYDPTLSEALEFYHPANRDRIRSFVETCRDGGEPYDVVLRIITAAGNERWVHTVGEPVADGDEVVALRGAVRDVTARREREQELQLFQKAVEQAGHGIVITDREGTIEYVNPAYERDSGYSHTEAVGRNPRLVKSGKHDATFYETLWETICSGEVWEHELINRRKSGELYHVEQTIAPITDDNDAITHFVAIESDVTEQRLREQRLNVLNRILRHNIRNGVNVIQGNATRLRNLTDDERDEALTAIEEQAAELCKISDNAAAVRDLFQRDRHPDATCDVGAMLLGLATDFDDDYPDTDITVTAPDPVTAQADDRLETAIRTAVDNAITHTDRAVPEITVSATPVDGPDTGDWVDVSIADNGPGIPPQERPMVEREAETQLVHGTGLELWHIYWIAKSFGGEMRITDNDPRGSVVTLRVPAGTT
ncbi:PAS domain-containing sensor histidine kinase [Natrinema hispanicum]|uniref:histidine kinase n=1 Tax=Natrinema hispanicum TaxID=392421 RepID=A0A1I0I679_9EURY|nr:PAS domain-containing sensor histidine kinase [Natrinema hispanicum]SDD21586.1 PAS domain S-box-containing protein [Natrinema hispanicum]SET91303.1 PAS domain S-box-containing protein [Natrinema hispanicum]